MLLQVVGTLAIILMLSFLVETLVEAIFGEPINHVPTLTPYKWTIMYLALGVGVLGAFVYQFDFICLLGRFLEIPNAPPVTTFGIVLTGLAIGRGSNYIHQVITKYFPNKRPAQPGDLLDQV